MDEVRIYNPSELFYDAAWNGDEDYVEVFLKVKDDWRYDCLDSSQVEGLPRYLENMAENEWATYDIVPQKTVEEVKADMDKAGFEWRKIIDWL
jgi:hypothetical protein